MTKTLIAAAAAVASFAGAVTGQVTTQGAAFQSGKEFANSAAGKAAASGSVRSTSAAQNVPKYNNNPPEASVYGGGRSLIGGAGSNKVLNCENYKAGNAYEQQECNAVNYLQNLRTRRVPFSMTPTDPLMVHSAGTIANPGTIATTGTQACRMVSSPVAAIYSTETCEQSTTLASFACNKTLVSECGYIGKQISQHSESTAGAFVSSTLSPTATLGLYDYLLEVPYRNCGGEGSGEIVFNLDTVGFGSYITINISNLDDAAAIGVNGTTVFAGYPNNGPQYSSGMFPTSAKSFQVGYSWQEDVGRETCLAADMNGNCTQRRWVPNVLTFSANTKLLDYCPAGYAATSQQAFASCDGDSNCSPPGTYTPNHLQGFFCNAEGKFLMNRHEGGGTWAGSVSSTMPLQKGENRLTVYWGTAPSSRTCGNVRVAGQIYNVAPGCTNRWDDQCADARSALNR
jgi:hypothetical protein